MNMSVQEWEDLAEQFALPENWWMGTTVDRQRRVEGAEKAFEAIA